MSISLPPGAGHEVAQEIATSLVPKPQIILEQTAEQAVEQWVRELARVCRGLCQQTLSWSRGVLGMSPMMIKDAKQKLT